MTHSPLMIAPLLAAMALSGCMVEPVTIVAPTTPVSATRVPATRVIVAEAPRAPTTRTETVSDAAGNVVTKTVTRVQVAPLSNSLRGDWNARENGNSDCKVNLGDAARPISGGQQAGARGCMGDRLLSLSAWTLMGETLVLKDAFGDSIANLHQTEHGVWSGNGISLWR